MAAPWALCFIPVTDANQIVTVIFAANSPPCSGQQIAQLIGGYAGHPHEHPRVIQIMISEIKFVGRLAYHHFPLIKVNPDDQRFAVLMLTRKEFAFYFESRSAV